jgi:hypothetical protein
MGRHRKSKHSGKRAVPIISGPFAAAYWRLRRRARKRGLFVLFDGDPAAPRFTFFDTTLGVALLDYWPKSGVWAYAARPGRGGRCDNHDEIIAVAVRLAGSCGAAGGNKSDLSHSRARDGL